MHLNIKIVQRSQWSAKIPHRACRTACYRQRRITAKERYSLLGRQSSFLRKVKMHPALHRVHFFTFQTNRCVFLFWIMSRRANHFQSDRPIANPAECGTHDARPSFRSKRGLYFFREAVRRLPVCELCLNIYSFFQCP